MKVEAVMIIATASATLERRGSKVADAVERPGRWRFVVDSLPWAPCCELRAVSHASRYNVLCHTTSRITSHTG